MAVKGVTVEMEMLKTWYKFKRTKMDTTEVSRLSKFTLFANFYTIFKGQIFLALKLPVLFPRNHICSGNLQRYSGLPSSGGGQMGRNVN